MLRGNHKSILVLSVAAAALVFQASGLPAAGGKEAKPAEPPAAGEGKEPPVSAPVRVADLSVTVRPARDPFALKEALALTIAFTNEGKQAVRLEVTEYLGTQTVGQYAYAIRDLGTKQAWNVGRDPHALLPGAPATLRVQQLQAGETLRTRVNLPGVGQRFWQGGTEDDPKKVSPFLPPGRYELVVTVTVGEASGKTKPVTFTVSDKEKAVELPQGLPREKVVEAARAFFARRLAVYKDANKEKPWTLVTADSFKATSEPTGKVWTVTFVADVKETGQRLTLPVVVDGGGKILSQNPGFVISRLGEVNPVGVPIRPANR